MVLIGPALDLVEERQRVYVEDEWISAVVAMFSAAYAID